MQTLEHWVRHVCLWIVSLLLILILHLATIFYHLVAKWWLNDFAYLEPWSCDQNKNSNHSMKKFKNLWYDRWLQYKQLCQESGLCCFSLVRYSQKCVTQIYRALSMFVFFGETQIWWPWRNKNICRWVLLLKLLKGSDT